MKQEIKLDDDLNESLNTLIELIRLLLEQFYVQNKMKMHSEERKRLIKEGKLDENYLLDQEEKPKKDRPLDEFEKFKVEMQKRIQERI